MQEISTAKHLHLKIIFVSYFTCFGKCLKTPFLPCIASFINVTAMSKRSFWLETKKEEMNAFDGTDRIQFCVLGIKLLALVVIKVNEI